MIKVYSFSYRYGGPPNGVVHIQDVRMLKNPYSLEVLRHMDGKDKEVQAFVASTAGFARFLETAVRVAKTDGEIAFGCVGGRHRSVACAEMAAAMMRDEGLQVHVEHTALGAEVEHV